MRRQVAKNAKLFAKKSSSAESPGDVVFKLDKLQVPMTRPKPNFFNPGKKKKSGVAEN